MVPAFGSECDRLCVGCLIGGVKSALPSVFCFVTDCMLLSLIGGVKSALPSVGCFVVAVVLLPSGDVCAKLGAAKRKPTDNAAARVNCNFMVRS